MRIVESGFEFEHPVDGAEILRQIERAGRTCYKSEAKITADSAITFVAKIINSGHESVLEHEKITVRVICDRGVSHEIVRHRIASYSQESTRYCDYAKSGDIQVIEPQAWFFKSQFSRREWEEAMRDAERHYNALRQYGESPQIARSVLPQSLKTEIVMTMNLREWRHFFRLRTSPAAHPQMRTLALSMLQEFCRLIPVVFDDIRVERKCIDGEVGTRAVLNRLRELGEGA